MNIDYAGIRRPSTRNAGKTFKVGRWVASTVGRIDLRSGLCNSPGGALHVMEVWCATGNGTLVTWTKVIYYQLNIQICADYYAVLLCSALLIVFFLLKCKLYSAYFTRSSSGISWLLPLYSLYGLLEYSRNIVLFFQWRAFHIHGGSDFFSSIVLPLCPYNGIITKLCHSSSSFTSFVSAEIISRAH